MTPRDTYDYLVRARRDLVHALEETPDPVLSRPVLPGPKFRSIKDLLFHIAEVEDGWINGDIRHGEFIQNAFPDLRNGGPDFSTFPLAILTGYWQRVEQSTSAWIATLTPDDLAATVAVEDWPEKHFTVDGLLSHVMIHEMRHTAQIAMLLCQQGIKPPSLDLLFYL